MKSVRVWMVLGALEPLGPSGADPSEEALEAEEFEQSFRLLFAVGNAAGRDRDGARAAISELKSAVSRAGTGRSPERVQKCRVTSLLPKSPSPCRRRLPRRTASRQQAAATQSQTIRVEVSRLDSLLNLVGELVIERAQIAPDRSRPAPALSRATRRPPSLLETTHRIARVTAELQDQIMKARMLPIDGVFQRMPRMVRDLAQKTGKEVRLSR